MLHFIIIAIITALASTYPMNSRFFEQPRLEENNNRFFQEITDADHSPVRTGKENSHGTQKEIVLNTSSGKLIESVAKIAAEHSPVLKKQCSDADVCTKLTPRKRRKIKPVKIIPTQPPIPTPTIVLTPTIKPSPPITPTPTIIPKPSIYPTPGPTVYPHPTIIVFPSPPKCPEPPYPPIMASPDARIICPEYPLGY